MPRLVFSPAARWNLAVIMQYLAKESGSPRIGHGFVAALKRKCDRLARLPGTLGRERPDVQPGVRSSAFKGYIIFFRYDANTLRVINVIEGHRDLGQHIDDDQV